MVRPWVVVTTLVLGLSQVSSALRFSVTTANCTAVTWELALTSTEWNEIFSVQLWFRNVTDGDLANPTVPISRDYIVSGTADIQESGITSITTPFSARIPAGSYQLGLYIYDTSSTNTLQRGDLIDSVSDSSTWSAAECQSGSAISPSSSSANGATTGPTSSSATPAVSSPSAQGSISNSNSEANPANQSSGSNKGKIVGAVVGGLLGALALIAAFIAFIHRRRRKQEAFQSEENRRVAALVALAGGGQNESKSYASMEEEIDVIQALATVPSREANGGGAWFQPQSVARSLSEKRSMQSFNFDIPASPTTVSHTMQHARSYTSLSIGGRSDGDARSQGHDEGGMVTPPTPSHAKKYKIRRVNVPAYIENPLATEPSVTSPSALPSTARVTATAAAAEEPIEFVGEDGPPRLSFSSTATDNFRSAEDLASLASSQGWRH